MTLGASRAALASPSAAPQDDERGVFFGASAGYGTAWIQQPGLSNRARPGAALALQAGWTLHRHVAIGGEFTAWGTSILGTPVHLHTIALRVEAMAKSATAGPFIAVATGLALTEARIGVRAGGAAALLGGYRWRVARWTSLGLELGMQAHLYADGAAMVPVVMLQVRFHGLRRR